MNRFHPFLKARMQPPLRYTTPIIDELIVADEVNKPLLGKADGSFYLVGCRSESNCVW